MNLHNSHPLANVTVPVNPSHMEEVYAAAIAQVKSIEPLIAEVEAKRYREYLEHSKKATEQREAARAERTRLVTAAASVKVAWWRLGSRKKKREADAAVHALFYRDPTMAEHFQERGVDYFVEPLQQRLDVATMARDTLILTADQVEHMARWADGRALADLQKRLKSRLQFQPAN